MKTAVNPYLCKGCGLCIDMRPSVFEKNSFGKARVKTDDITETDYRRCLLIAHLCPAKAISFGDTPQTAYMTIRQNGTEEVIQATTL